MAIQRWATYSVRDHTKPKAFVADVLLFDKLVLPVPPENEPAERDRWRHEGWNPAWLDTCLEELGDLAEPFAWHQGIREYFKDQWVTARVLGAEPFHATRMFIRRQFPEDDVIRPVVPFDSEEALQNSIGANDVQRRIDGIAIACKHRFLVPDSNMESDLDLLRRAVDLAKDAEFRKARTALYHWQEQRVASGYSDKAILDELETLLRQYDQAMGRAKWKSTVRYATFFAGLSVPVARELGLIAAGVSLAFDGGLKVVEFVNKEKSDDPRALEPAAMLHTARKELSLREPRAPAAH
jgi:hypothetical protein